MATGTSTNLKSSTINVDWKRWADERRKLGEESDAEYEGSRTKLKKALSKLALEIVNQPEHNWLLEAAERNVIAPASTHKYMPATAATFGATALMSDYTKKQRAADLDRKALAVHYLVLAAEAAPTRFDASEDGVDALCDLIDEKGGVSAISSEQRKANAAAKQKTKPVDSDVIVLDAEAVRNTAIARARYDLTGNQGQIRIALVVDNGSKTTVEKTLSEDVDAINSALLEMDAVEPRVDRMGELLQAGAMVREEPSAALKDMHDDPEKPASGHRDATRHIIFEDQKTVSIAPILISSSVIVQAVSKVDIIDYPLAGPCHLRTRERRKLEVNIIDAARRRAFKGSFEGPGETQGVCYFTAETDALPDNDEAGNIESVRVLVEPLRGTMPIKADLTRFDAKVTGGVSLISWKAIHSEFVKKHTKTEKDINDATKAKKASAARQKHRFEKGLWSIHAKTQSREIECAEIGATVEVEILEADFYRVSEVIANLPITTPITIKADAYDGLLLEFVTRNFAYHVYIPAVTNTGGRTTSLIGRYKAAE